MHHLKSISFPLPDVGWLIGHRYSIYTVTFPYLLSNISCYLVLFLSNNVQAFTKGERRENKAQKPIEIQNQELRQTSAENQKISEKIAANKTVKLRFLYIQLVNRKSIEESSKSEDQTRNLIG